MYSTEAAWRPGDGLSRSLSQSHKLGDNDGIDRLASPSIPKGGLLTTTHNFQILQMFLVEIPAKLRWG